MAAIRNATCDHSSPNLRKSHPAISIVPTIPILGIQHRLSPISRVEAAEPNYHQHRDIQRKSKKAERPTGNALAAAEETTNLTIVLNIHGNMQRFKVQIDCGAMSICILPSLLRKLELPYEPAFTSTLARC
jgi:hypothetical protein